MAESLPSFPARIAIAFACFFRALGDARFAAEVDAVAHGAAGHAGLPRPQTIELPPAPTASQDLPVPRPLAEMPSAKPGALPAPVAPTAVTTVAPAATVPAGATAHEGALHLLAVLQREGRLLDFCEEELAGFSDAAVGAAARLVHSGCRKAVRENLELLPVRTEAEGAKVTIPVGFDARAIRLTGNIVGNPPFTGALKHHGWRVEKVKLPDPPRGDAARLLAPAEVELP